MTRPIQPPGSLPNVYQPGKGHLAPEDLALITRRQKLLGPAYRLFYETPVHLVRGEGVWLFDPAGNAYLDTYNNVASLGHCHPHVVAATARQAAIFASHTRYLHDGVLAYAEKLLAYFPAPLSHVMFTCTGSEANDLAIRIAQAHTGGTGVIVTENAYHGVTSSISAMSPSLGPGVPLGAHVRTIPAPDALRLGSGEPADLGAAFAAEVDKAAADLLRHGIKPAALLVDTVFSSDGLFVEPAGFLAPAVAAIHAAGGLFIADEVQPGFGRTGAAMWGFQRHGIVPDMVSLGKPMGNGYPLAGLVLQPSVIEAFAGQARYFNTFGGNAVAAATGMAVLEVIENEGLLQNAATVGAYFRAGLEDLASRDDTIGPIRSAGLFLAAEIVKGGDPLAPDAPHTQAIVTHLREARVLISTTGPRANALKIRPPLVFTTSNVDHFLAKLEDALRA
jgi:4-aminobutyrate aminotransferase-like enzyme